ncbi:alpha-galactosidase [Paenibacillus sp. J22TS3]|uniref:alpha-galactosidase n=1 Tax=Paenibacillus sp. J22TS3 TaxID=2807192 RepID=UPI001AFFDBF3|nr:alpha-galactosidase [Paenibacillus sp. J22TS3]GIP19750.1 alpha-galactosidase [Paenibacillus sp. J22TS3]
MSIQYNAESRIFHLTAGGTSYVMQIIRDGYLSHLYWGKRLRRYAGSNELQYLDRGFSPNPDPDDRTFSLDTLPQEYPAYGATDFRNPAYQVQLQDGTTVSDLRVRSHRIVAGKPALPGLPAAYAEDGSEAETLLIELADEVSGLAATLSYTVYEQRNVITRSVLLRNEGTQPQQVLRAFSANVDFRDDGFDLVHLPGAWARERHMERQPLHTGIQSIESRRGASSHQHNPFFALARKDATERSGEVYAFSLVYSGSFTASVEVDQFSTARASIGLNDFDFSWRLEPGEAFQCPEALLVYSADGLGGMSRTFHSLFRERMCRGEFRDRERPILINNWEGTYFDFNAESIEQFAEAGRELGMELFVLDDGWFGKRNDDKTSLGDWFVNESKLPGGLGKLAGSIVDKGMRFGLWVEPEMISRDSELYRKHPDWCLHVPGRSRSEGRSQLVLDFTRDEVCSEIVRSVSDILRSAPITYVKWDMNRHMTEIGSPALPPERQRETAHRYMLGLYKIMEELTSAFPHVLFESCSGGGGRFDPGMLYYMPQTWTSDNTDAVSRLKIQYGTSLVYPVSTMGAHVSAVPNHQVHRTTTLEMRGHVAMSGNFGYELDVTALSEEEQTAIRSQIEFYSAHRALIQFGDLYRLLSPFEGSETAWMFVSKDKCEALVFYFRTGAEANSRISRILLQGLDEQADYACEQGIVYGGDELMSSGLAIPALWKEDYESMVWKFTQRP